VIALQYAPELSDEVTVVSQFLVAVLGVVAEFKATNADTPTS
jgi:hypothetical protein